MLHGRNNENILHMKQLLFPWEKESFVPAMQHGCRAKPLLIQQQSGIIGHVRYINISNIRTNFCDWCCFLCIQVSIGNCETK